MKLEIQQELAPLFAGQDPFAVIRRLDGEVYKRKDDRRVVRFEFQGRAYFLKHHQGVGWPEIVKNWMTLRKPVTGAEEEWEALNFLKNHDIATMEPVAYGVESGSPASRHSFLITRELPDSLSISDLCEHWRSQGVIPHEFKVRLIAHVARVARILHDGGMNHRDFYSHHFLLPRSVCERPEFSPDEVWLVDLHRAQIRASIPWRWRVKDIGSLYFSALEFPDIFTLRDAYRFMRLYSGKPLKQTLQEDARLWQGAWRRAHQIYTRYYKKQPPHWLPLSALKSRI